MTRSKSSSVIFSRDLSRRMPALVTRMSRRPNASTAVRTSCWAASVLPTGATAATARPPSASMVPDRFRGDRGVHVVDDDGGALAGEFPGVGQAEAAAASGDDCYFA